LRILYLSLIVVIVDQVSKLLVKGFSIPFLNFYYEGMDHGQRIPIIGDFFRLTFIENPGMAFGLDPGLDFKIWISLFSLAASIGLVFYLYHIRNEIKSLRVAIAFILGGAVGNLIDRMFYGVIFDYAPLFYGKVVDFLDFDFFNVTIFGRNYDRWPIFNIADSAVTIGVIILLLFYKKHQKAEEVQHETEVQPVPDSADEENQSENPNENELDNGEADTGKKIPL